MMREQPVQHHVVQFDATRRGLLTQHAAAFRVGQRFEHRLGQRTQPRTQVGQGDIQRYRCTRRRKQQRASVRTIPVERVEQRMLRIVFAGDGIDVVDRQHIAARHATNRHRTRPPQAGQRQVLGRAASVDRGLARRDQQMGTAAAQGAGQKHPWRGGIHRRGPHGFHRHRVIARMEMLEALASRPTQCEGKLGRHGWPSPGDGGWSRRVFTMTSTSTSTSTCSAGASAAGSV